MLITLFCFFTIPLYDRTLFLFSYSPSPSLHSLYLSVSFTLFHSTFPFLPLFFSHTFISHLFPPHSRLPQSLSLSLTLDLTNHTLPSFLHIYIIRTRSHLLSLFLSFTPSLFLSLSTPSPSILLFPLSTWPSGEGTLKSRDNSRMLGTDKEHLLLAPEEAYVIAPTYCVVFCLRHCSYHHVLHTSLFLSLCSAYVTISIYHVLYASLLLWRHVLPWPPPSYLVLSPSITTHIPSIWLDRT